jgi:hypothetical protein
MSIKLNYKNNEGELVIGVCGCGALLVKAWSTRVAIL